MSLFKNLSPIKLYLILLAGIFITFGVLFFVLGPVLFEDPDNDDVLILQPPAEEPVEPMVEEPDDDSTAHKDDRMFSGKVAKSLRAPWSEVNSCNECHRVHAKQGWTIPKVSLISNPL